MQRSAAAVDRHVWYFKSILIVTMQALEAQTLIRVARLLFTLLDCTKIVC